MMKNKKVFAMYIATIWMSLGANMAHPVTPTIIVDLNLPDYMFGVAFAAMSIMQFLSSPMWVSLQNKIGVRKVSSLCMVGYAVGQLIFGVATGSVMIVLGRAVAGFFAAGVMCGQLKYIIDNTAVAERGKALGMTATIQAVLSPFGYLIGGFIGDVSIMGTFVVQAVFLFSLAIYYFVFIKDNKEGTTKFKASEFIKEANPFKIFGNAKKSLNKRVVLFLLLTCILFICQIAFDQAYNFFIKDVYGYSSSYNGVIKAGIGFITLITNITILVVIVKNKKINQALMFIGVACFALIINLVFFNEFSIFVIIVVLVMLMISMINPLIQNLLPEFQDDDNVIIGLFNSMKSIGMFVGSLMVGGIYSINPKYCFIFAAVMFMLTSVIAFRLNRIKE